jgi:hypothetical protein
LNGHSVNVFEDDRSHVDEPLLCRWTVSAKQ